MASPLSHWLHQLAVVDGLVRTVLPTNGCSDVTLHLLWCETAWSPGSLRVLQRRSRAVPASEPILDGSASSGYGVAMRECTEAVSGGAWRVLEEDLMLLLWCELLHAWLRAAVVKGALRRGLGLCIENSALADVKRAPARHKNR